MEVNFQKYIEYIRNTGGRPTISQFDDDWQPIGPLVRKDMKAAGVTDESGGFIIVLEPQP